MTSYRFLAGLVGAAMVAQVIAPGMVRAAEKDPVAATVDGFEIRLSDVQGARGLLPMNLQGEPFEAVYDLLLDSLINTHIAAERAREQGLDEDPDFKRRMARVREQLLERLLLTRHIESKITEDALKKRYDALVEQAKDAHEVHARHILVKSEGLAKSLIGKLDDGADFAELAKKHSIGPSAPQGGDLGWFGPGRMVGAFDDAAMALEAGTYSKTPVETQYGWHIIKVEEIRPLELPPYEQARPALTSDYSAELGQTLMDELRSDAKIDKVDYKDIK